MATQLDARRVVDGQGAHMSGMHVLSRLCRADAMHMLQRRVRAVQRVTWWGAAAHPGLGQAVADIAVMVKGHRVGVADVREPTVCMA